MSRARFTLAAALLALPAVLAAQDRRFITGAEMRTVSFQSGLSYSKVSEFVVPIGIVWNVSPRLSVDVGTRIASASTTTAPDSAGHSVNASLSGPTDTQVRLVYQIRPDVLAFTLSANLPTGKSQLTSDQLGVAGPIAHDLIPYPVSAFGSGASVTTGLAVAVPVAGWAVGVGGSFRMNGGYSFAPAADSVANHIKPGAEMRVRLGLDKVIGDGHASFGLTYSTFANDEISGQQFNGQPLQPGARMISEASWSQPFLGMNVAVYGWDLYRGSTADSSHTPATEKQNLLALGGVATIQQGQSQWRPSVEYRRHWTGLTSVQAAGTLLSLGLRYARPVSERMTVLPGLRYDFGNVIGNAGSDVGYTGFSASMMVRTSW